MTIQIRRIGGRASLRGTSSKRRGVVLPPKRTRTGSLNPSGGRQIAKASGRLRPFSHGHGLASPGRWPPHARPSGDLDEDLLFHKDLMDGLLNIISNRMDYKRAVCFLATGKCKESPFSDPLLREARELLFAKLLAAGCEEPIEDMPERQPFLLHAISELLRLAGDPDWRQYTQSSHSFAAGVPLGVDARLPRCPALFGRKMKHRDYSHLGGDQSEGFRENYSSVEPYTDQVQLQFDKEIAMGAMTKLTLQEAVEIGRDRLSIASLGALPIGRLAET